MGKGLVDELQEEFDLQVQWLPLEIHPETHPQGRPISQVFPPSYMAKLRERLNQMGKPFGVTFAETGFLPNSNLALQAAEFARERGAFDPFHDAVFRAYFSQARDIGQVDVLKEIGRDVGLDAQALGDALQRGEYRPILEQTREEAIRRDVTAIPTFVIEEEEVLVGIQPLHVFRNALRSFQAAADARS